MSEQRARQSNFEPENLGDDDRTQVDLEARVELAERFEAEAGRIEGLGKKATNKVAAASFSGAARAWEQAAQLLRESSPPEPSRVDREDLDTLRNLIAWLCEGAGPTYRALTRAVAALDPAQSSESSLDRYWLIGQMKGAAEPENARVAGVPMRRFLVRLARSTRTTLMTGTTPRDTKQRPRHGYGRRASVADDRLANLGRRGRVTRVRCWLCLGRGWIDGPIYRARCPNPHCPHRPPTALEQWKGEDG